MNKKSYTSILQEYSGRVKDLFIPLPYFQFFHKSSSEEEIDPKFIGREEIGRQLTEWLENGYAGSYLVSGYRGMGKSSFVGKVLNDITDTDKTKCKWSSYCFVGISICFFVAVFFVTFCFIYKDRAPFHRLVDIANSIVAVSLAIMLLLRVVLCFINKEKRVSKVEKKIRKVIEEQFAREGVRDKDELQRKVESFYKQNADWLKDVYGVNVRKKDKRRIVIKINLGHEILNERDVLSMIAKRLHKEYDTYIHDDYINPIQPKNIKIIGASILTAVVMAFLAEISFTLILTKNVFINSVKDLIIRQELARLFFDILVFVGLFFLIKLLLNKIIRAIPSLRNISSQSILDDLAHLTDRIDTTVNEDIGPNVSYTNQSIIGLSFNRKKTKTYGIANVREIEMELTQILDDIHDTNVSFKIFGRQIKSNKPKFVIVFDELDKIDPEYNQNSKTEVGEIPEYSNSTSGFSGGMTSRNRKQNVLRLLGNMKLFLSSAKAKFIFISGRELYDALLADLSDREFAISSIFNGTIYVDSFFESSNNEKDIIHKTSEYISRQLIPRAYYQEKAQRLFEENIHNRLVASFDMYHQFLLDTLPIKTATDTYPWHTAEERKDYVNPYFIDKIISFLSQFASYLSHISNGSPKKITMYFEQYISEFYSGNSKNPFSLAKDTYFKDCKYCLAFSQRDQQSIGFIHYMTYPVVRAIVNMPAEYTDKVIISISFLVNHIFKHHEGGFSWDNIEHIPELLEVYRTPDLRSLINDILSFYQQSHITFISSGLYYYKIRNRISEEISYFSKISEEVSAIFNFTLDESLSVKRYYDIQIKYYIDLYNKLIGSSKESTPQGNNPYAITLIKLYEVLGELHLLDGEYSDAIIQFQNGLQLIKIEWESYKEDSKENKQKKQSYEQGQLSLLINMIDNVLKLGLVHESQRTYNTAYTIYCELITYLIDFRNVDESVLSLKYAVENHPEEWSNSRSVYYHTRESRSEENDATFRDKVYPALMDNVSLDRNAGVSFADVDYMLTGDDLVSELSKPLSPLKGSIISKLTLFEDIRYMFQIILAKLFVLEKINLGGITKANLDIAESEFAYMYLTANIKDKFIIAADFYRKLAAMLYFKNGYIIFDFRNALFLRMEVWGYVIGNDIRDFCLEYKPNNFSEKYIVSQVLFEFAACEFDGEIFDIDSSQYKCDRYVEYPECDYCPERNNCDNYRDRVRYIKNKLWQNIEKVLDEKSERDGCHVWNASKKAIVKEFITSPYFRFVDSTINPSIVNCSKYCKQMFNQGIQLPCYACNYYCRTLKIFQKHVLNKGTTTRKGVSRVFYFLDGLANRSDLTTLRTNYLITMASTLRGMADVQLSCVSTDNKETKDYVIGSDFLAAFFKMTEGLIGRKRYNSEPINVRDYFVGVKMTRMQKSILYYFTASEYFRIADTRKDTVECLRKILHIIINSIKINRGGAVLIADFLPDIKKYILQKILTYSYSLYNNVNISEIQHVKQLVDIDLFNHVSLNKLSLFPDVEESLLLYYELELLCDKIDIVQKCYNSIIMSPYRTDNSIFAKIYAYNLKATINQAILKSVFGGDLFESDFPLMPQQCYSDLATYLNENYDIRNGKFAQCLGIATIEPDDVDSKVELLNFLISDSLSCLIQIVDALTITKVTQFNNMFMGDTYYRIFLWAQFYLFNYTLLHSLGDLDHNHFSKIERMVSVRSEVFSSNECRYDKDKLLQATKNKYNVCRELLANQRVKMTGEKFKDGIEKMLKSGNNYYLTASYSAEMAIKYYTEAREMHAEGKAYKNFINELYIVDDDINNSSTTFAFASERYFLNCHYIDNRISPLKKLFLKSSYYDPENYL